MIIHFNPRRIYDIILVCFKWVKQVFLALVGFNDLHLLLSKERFLSLNNDLFQFHDYL